MRKNCTGTASASYWEFQDGCPHRNGWFVYVWYFWIFYKKIFVCSDCGKPMEVKKS